MANIIKEELGRELLDSISLVILITSPIKIFLLFYYDIFASSTIDEKRQLLGYVFSNLELEGQKLVYTLQKPFNLFADLASCQEWLPLLSTLRTKRREQVLVFNGYYKQNLFNYFLSYKKTATQRQGLPKAMMRKEFRI